MVPSIVRRVNAYPFPVALFSRARIFWQHEPLFWYFTATHSMHRITHQISVGCCGFALAQSVYFKMFNTVEINSSFYQLPRLKTAAGWRAAAPDGFTFAMRAWQPITHPSSCPTYHRTRIDERDKPYCGHFGFNPTIRWAWNETFSVAKELGVFLVLFQSPPGFGPSKSHIARLRAFFERAKRDTFLMGWEPRGNWEAAQVDDLCRELNLIHVADPLSAQPPPPGCIRYYRLHGKTGRSYQHTDADLSQLKMLADGHRPVWFFFNNASMVRDAQRFTRIIAR